VVDMVVVGGGPGVVVVRGGRGSGLLVVVGSGSGVVGVGGDGGAGW
jgi:hypothetical protein